ncbi:hypothetical protein C8D89_11267 [Actinomycetospora cinnamomea]|uniref:Uncharacterized protein n=1 Tax=Actinomycetospora cinnamomea TaxID=663609 RepID=A0A2U1F3X0_9PSEU|nr:hypothetical protein C8D89_11267 [Actinomycetospora cinnamomea]
MPTTGGATEDASEVAAAVAEHLLAVCRRPPAAIIVEAREGHRRLTEKARGTVEVGRGDDLMPATSLGLAGGRVPGRRDGAGPQGTDARLDP